MGGGPRVHEGSWQTPQVDQLSVANFNGIPLVSNIAGCFFSMCLYQIYSNLSHATACLGDLHVRIVDKYHKCFYISFFFVLFSIGPPSGGLGQSKYVLLDLSDS